MIGNNFSEMKRRGLWKTHALVYIILLAQIKKRPDLVARAAGAEAGAPIAEEAETLWEKVALFHGEALCVVAAGDAEDVAFPFAAAGVLEIFLS